MWRSPHPERERRQDTENEHEVDPRKSELGKREDRSAQRVASAEAEEHSPGEQKSGSGSQRREYQRCARPLGDRKPQKHGEEAGRRPDDHENGQPARGIRAGDGRDARQRPGQNAEGQTVEECDGDGENGPSLLGCHLGDDGTLVEDPLVLAASLGVAFLDFAAP